MFARRRSTYVAFDLLFADGVDLRPLPLRESRERTGGRCALYRAVVEVDLEDVVAKRRSTPITRSMSGGRGSSIGPIRSAGRGPNGSPSGGVLPGDDDIGGQRLKCDFGGGRPILPATLVGAFRFRGGARGHQPFQCQFDGKSLSSNRLNRC
jgi:hypothetical protein